MKHEYIVLNKIQSHIITWGNPFHSNGLDVIICVTGNPGITDFYVEFASYLHDATGLPLCIIGQAGHEEVPDQMSNCLRGQEHLFNLQGQILHKLELINNYIDKEARLHFIGHSIGAWLILESLENNLYLKNRIASINLLFPTLQKMSDTLSGKFLNNVLRRCHLLIILFLQLLNLFPSFVLNFIAKVYLKINSLPLAYKERILKFVNPKACEKFLSLAYNEMDIVKKLNVEMLDAIKHLTTVIYSIEDHWAPLHYMDDLRVFQPSLKMIQMDVSHAFVLKSSKTVAETVSGLILKHK